MDILHHDDLLRWLEANAEPAYAQFSVALLPGMNKKMWGIRLPKLRKLAKELAHADLSWVFREILTTDSFEEVMLRGFVIGYTREEWGKTWEEIRKFVPLIDNWETCDCCSSSFLSVRKHREEVWPVLLQYLSSAKEFEQRFGVVMMMEHFLTDDYIDAVLQAWSRVRPAGYYVEMAIGWGLSKTFLTYRQQTMQVLLDERVPVPCRKKACQKLLESRRTPDEFRAEIKALKSKY